MASRRIVGATLPVALFTVACLAAGYFTAFFTDSLIITAVAGVVAGAVAGWVAGAVRRRRG